MIFAQTNRYGKRQDLFSQDDRQGASVAHAELLRAVLSYGNVEGVELFVNGSPHRPPAVNLEFVELCREFPEKSLKLRNLDQLGNLPPESKYVFYISGVFLSALAQTRRSLGKRFPICCFSHAIDIPIVSQFIPGAILLGEEHDVIITSSKAGKRALQNMVEQSLQVVEQRFGGGISRVSPRIETIPLGVDTSELYPRDKKQARDLLHLPPDETILIYVGRLNEEHKADLEPVLIVLRELLRKTPDVTLLIAGHDHDNTYFSELDAIAARLAVRHKVRFLLNFQDFLKPFIYSAGDIFIAPSDNIQETFGIAILEAMACGLPVVAADWSGYRDIVVDGRTGFLVRTLWNKEAADFISVQASSLPDSSRRHMLAQQTVLIPSEMYWHLHTLIGDAALRKAFGAEGLARARSEFSWKAVISMHEALWVDLWNQLEAKKEGRKIPVDDLDFLLSHFATSTIGPDTLVGRSVLRADLDNALRLRPARPGYEITEPMEIRRVAERASMGTISIRQLIRDGIARDSLSIVWLLKKGFLRIVDDTAQGRDELAI